MGARWGAACDDCDFIISVDGDGKDVPDPAEWESFPACPVCGSTVSFDEQGETQWNRETRLMHGVAKRAAEKALREAADAWTQGEWANHMVTASDPAQIRIGSANRFGEWLRDRAKRIGGGGE